MWFFLGVAVPLALLCWAFDLSFGHGADAARDDAKAPHLACEKLVGLYAQAVGAE
jgi:hypothetical protein